MAQHALIARELPDQSVEYAYLHYGSFEDAGSFLLRNCAAPEQAAVLLALGDHSAVDDPAGTSPDAEPHTAGPYRAASLAALIQQLNSRRRGKNPAAQAGRIYCHTPETGWLHYFRKAAAAQPLAEILNPA